jgi:predicted nucleic acid-binding protein
MKKSNNVKSYMLDTNVFNHLVEGKITVEQFAEYELYATHIQKNELEECPTLEKRSKLLSIFQFIGPKTLPTPSAVWDVSEWDESCWSDSDGIYGALLNRIIELDRKLRKKSRNPYNQPRDALIAETVIKNNLTLITNDKNLTTAIIEHGGTVIDLKN